MLNENVGFVVVVWTGLEVNRKRGKCSVSSSLFLCMLCFLFGQKQCSESWLVVCFLRNETQMKFKCGFNSYVHGVLFMSAICDKMIVLQSFKSSKILLLCYIFLLYGSVDDFETVIITIPNILKIKDSLQF